MRAWHWVALLSAGWMACSLGCAGGSSNDSSPSAAGSPGGPASTGIGNQYGFSSADAASADASAACLPKRTRRASTRLRSPRGMWFGSPIRPVEMSPTLMCRRWPWRRFKRGMRRPTSPRWRLGSARRTERIGRSFSTFCRRMRLSSVETRMVFSPRPRIRRRRTRTPGRYRPTVDGRSHGRTRRS